MLQDDSLALSRRQKLELVSRTLRTFRLTDDDGIAELFLGTTLPTTEFVARHLRARAVLLPPSITPEFVADRILTAIREAKADPRDVIDISCWDIDQFRPFKDVDATGVTLPLRVSEREIKDRLNALLGEYESAKDWGGEDNDLFAMCSVNDREMPIAMMLKGPSVPRPMRIKDAGKNSDQILRLAESAATLFVVQHVHKITDPVRRDLRGKIETLRGRGFEAYCSFIDGIQTYKILSGSRLKVSD